MGAPAGAVIAGDAAVSRSGWARTLRKATASPRARWRFARATELGGRPLALAAASCWHGGPALPRAPLTPLGRPKRGGDSTSLGCLPQRQWRRPPSALAWQSPASVPRSSEGTRRHASNVQAPGEHQASITRRQYAGRAQASPASCQPYASIRKAPCKHDATTPRTLRNHGATMTQPLRNNYANFVQPLHSHYAAITQRLRSRYAAVVQPVCSQTAITQTLRRHCAAIARPCQQCALVAQASRKYLRSTRQAWNKFGLSFAQASCKPSASIWQAAQPHSASMG